jgi:hypothetical protein
MLTSPFHLAFNYLLNKFGRGEKVCAFFPSYIPMPLKKKRGIDTYLPSLHAHTMIKI